MTIYTIITANYDNLKEPLVLTNGWRYICFTDNPGLKSSSWEISLINPTNSRNDAKRYKILPYEYIDDPYTIYIDGSFIINCDLNMFYALHSGRITFMKHPYRNCVYSEIDACIKYKKDRSILLNNVKAEYKRERIPPNSGLASSGIIMRSGGEDFCKLWFELYMKGCNRDQISWAYANWKMPGYCNMLSWDYRTATEFIYIPHNNQPDKQAARLAYLKVNKYI